MPDTVDLPALAAEDFMIPVPESASEVFTIYSKQLGPFNGGGYEGFSVKDGYLDIGNDPDLAILQVRNRYGSGGFASAPIRGFGLKKGAVVSTVAHDCHNLMSIYRDPADALIAVQAVKKSGGGIAVAADGRLVSMIPLPVAGLMSDAPVADLVEDIRKTEEAVGDLCSGSSLLKMATFALSALPGAILTDQGIIMDSAETFTPLFR